MFESGRGMMLDLVLAATVLGGAATLAVHGFWIEPRRRLFVFSGLATTFLPARSRVPPETAILTLRCTDG